MLLFNNSDIYTIIIVVWFMVFNATFNNISVISWRSVLLMGKQSIQRKPPFSYILF